MKTTKHTPGPWAVGDESEDFANVFANDEHEVASLHRSPDRDVHDISEEQLRANARLIAAAPEMLEALKAALSAIETPGDLTPAEVSHVIEDCEIAIAKAEGGAS